jgi:hypothetical protein
LSGALLIAETSESKMNRHDQEHIAMIALARITVIAALTIAVGLIAGIIVARAQSENPSGPQSVWSDGSGEYWYCGKDKKNDVVSIRRSREKESSKDYWEVFKVQVGVTDRTTSNHSELRSRYR